MWNVVFDSTTYKLENKIDADKLISCIIANEERCGNRVINVEYTSEKEVYSSYSNYNGQDYLIRNFWMEKAES